MTQKALPNILITGTPGCGKTTTASLVAEALPELSHQNISELVKIHSLHSGKDAVFDSLILDEDAVLYILLLLN